MREINKRVRERTLACTHLLNALASLPQLGGHVGLVPRNRIPDFIERRQRVRRVGATAQINAQILELVRDSVNASRPVVGQYRVAGGLRHHLVVGERIDACDERVAQGLSTRGGESESAIRGGG